MVTVGTLTIRTGNEEIAARAGDLIYVPAGSSGRLHADEAVEVVRVAYPPEDD